MANTFVLSRRHLILGLCLPLAILLGYLLADPMESSSLAIVIMVLSVLSVPLLLRWHHPLLIFAWNATIILGFLPGQPYLWMLLAFVGFLLAVLGRATNPDRRFLQVPALNWPLGCLTAVVVVTAWLTGGFGVQALGAERVGGRGYFYILAAVMGYFALTSQLIPWRRSQLYVAVFFLSGLTATVSNLIYFFPSAYFLYYWFPPTLAYDQAMSGSTPGDYSARVSGLMVSALAVNAFLLARYGWAGVLDLKRPWRLALLLGAGFASLYGGFRSAVVFELLLFAILFTIEGLWRTRYALWALGAALLVGIGLVTFVDKMPLEVQRAVSFLPLNVDPLTKESGNVSTEWRLEMWRTLWPAVPGYLFKGKGYAVDPQELDMMTDFARRGRADSEAIAAFSGDYHNGPLSVLIPFGIYGVVTFLWFLGAGGWVLRQNHLYGRPALRTVNTFLLALFITRAIIFFFIYGALYYDLFQFTGLLGLSIALNGGVGRPDEGIEPTEDIGPTED